jgi:signal transduction histidine kinase
MTQAKLPTADPALCPSDAIRSVAHDFNNLVGVIHGYLELLAMSDLDEPQRRQLDAVRGAAEEAGKLCLDLSIWAESAPRAAKVSRRRPRPSRQTR